MDKEIQYKTDCRYMQRCLQLAALGAGHVSPNPMVGAVIVHRDKIIGEGYHRKYGSAHAEVNAVRSVKNPELLKESVIYVSLEPCSHYGKTPPCSKLIIDNHISRVVVGCLDPYAEVSGRGVRMLQEAGIEVTVGVLEEECRWQNRYFMTSQEKQRPYILLKWAQSADGFIDRERTADESPSRISDHVTTALVHKLRAEYDAVLVGTHTAIKDNPSLTVRQWAGHNPLRVVIDRKLVLSPQSHLWDGIVQTLVFTECSPINTSVVDSVKIDFSQPVIPQVLKELNIRKIQSLLVEGGGILLQNFIDEGLWDEARVEICKHYFRNGVTAPCLISPCDKEEYYGEQSIYTYYNR